MDVSFLTPLGALFSLAAAVPLLALLATERRAGRIRRALSLSAPSRRALAPVVLALVLLPTLVAVAAAQPVVVRQRQLAQRADAQAFFVFDTSLSMSARSSPGAPTRLARAKREALRLWATLGDIPAGIASMTDRTLPNLLPTTDRALFVRTLRQSVGIDRPPPSQQYRDRATALQALLTIGDSHFFAPGVTHRILVVFTDGEASRLPDDTRFTLPLQQLVPPLLVHVWAGDEAVYVHGKVDRRYQPDPASGPTLEEFASLTKGRVFGEHDIGQVASAVDAEAGKATKRTTVAAYARIALAPWLVLAGVVPLGFLFWRRNL
jgi:hypothetical protein